MNLDQATPVLQAGTAKQELRCRRCGYEAIIIGHLPSCPMCQASAWEELDLTQSTRTSASDADDPAVRPTWEMVVDLLEALSSTQDSFDGISGRSFRLDRYHRDWRVLTVAEGNSRWVDVGDIRACWETFERLGRIEREDVLDPGRCSSFMMALFGQLPGIEQAAGGSPSLTFA